MKLDINLFQLHKKIRREKYLQRSFFRSRWTSIWSIFGFWKQSKLQLQSNESLFFHFYFRLLWYLCS